MKSVVIELQQEALDRKVRVSDLLRKALVVARKLGLRDFQNWIEKELNGYTKEDEGPKYRQVNGQVRGLNPYRGWIPLIFENAKTGEMLSRRAVGQPIATLEHLAEGNDQTASLHIPFPQAMQRELSKGFGFETEVSLFTSQSSVVGIIDAVRTIILNWALKLEEEGILGEGLSFTAKERETASKSSQNVTNFYGPVQSPQIQQGNEQAVQVTATFNVDAEGIRAFLGHLKAVLPQLQLGSDQAGETKAEIQTLESQLESPKPKSGIVVESLQSLRRILESAGGGAATQLLIELGKLLL